MDSSGNCTFTATNCASVDCDGQDYCSNICDGLTVKSYQDYYVVSNGSTCTYAWGITVKTCSNAHGSTACDNAACSPTCNSGYDDCDSNPDNGCETYSDGDLDHCGSCDNLCSLSNATETCTGGNCRIVSCAANWWNADTLDATGCECADSSATTQACGGGTNIGTIVSGSTYNQTGVIAYSTTIPLLDVDCYSVTFLWPTPGTGTFRIALTPVGNLEMKVWRGDCGSLACTENMDPDGNGELDFTSWCNTATPCMGNNQDVNYFVCVSARSGVDNLCQPYTLTFQHIP